MTPERGAAAGRVVVLNGTTSAGKSTLARTLRQQLADAGEPWVVIGLDDFFARAPREWFRIGDHIGPHAEDGMVFELVDGHIERRVGWFARTLLAGYRAAIAGMARAGLDVIVDEVLLSHEDWLGWRAELAELDVTWVRVEAPHATTLQRERERGDRVIGMAAAQFDVVHAFADYDVRIDTGQLAPEPAAEEIVQHLRRRPTAGGT